jgi:hypothetical protein
MHSLRHALPLAFALGAVLPACQRDPASVAVAPVAQASPTAAPTSPGAREMPASLAARYTCHGECAGISHELDLLADGTYWQRGMPPVGEGVENSERGHWSIDQDGRRLVLSPSDRDGPPLYFERVADGEITLVGTDGVMVDMSYTLKNTGG